MQTHTPAPWRVQKRELHSGLGYNVKIIAGFVPGDNRRVIATANNYNPNCGANANIMAAAPDLLKSLEEAAQTLDEIAGACDVDSESDLSPARFHAINRWAGKAANKVRAAIENAKGESNELRIL